MLAGTVDFMYQWRPSVATSRVVTMALDTIGIEGNSSADRQIGKFRHRHLDTCPAATSAQLPKQHHGAGAQDERGGNYRQAIADNRVEELAQS